MKLKKKHDYVYINSVYENMRYPVFVAFISDRQNLIIDYLISSFLESGVDRECQNFLLNLAGGKFARGRGVGSFGYLHEYRLIYCFLNFFQFGRDSFTSRIDHLYEILMLIYFSYLYFYYWRSEILQLNRN